jgi:hypothetical protein
MLDINLKINVYTIKVSTNEHKYHDNLMLCSHIKYDVSSLELLEDWPKA